MYANIFFGNCSSEKYMLTYKKMGLRWEMYAYIHLRIGYLRNVCLRTMGHLGNLCLGLHTFSNGSSEKCTLTYVQHTGTLTHLAHF